jgi:hydroxyacylglutathione hydrolase
MFFSACVDAWFGYILHTHRQEDFEFGSATLAQMTGAMIVSGCHELFGQTDIKLKDGAELEVGTACIVALETPGHTPESTTYAIYVEDSGKKCWGAFTGDALFVGDTGRTDLPAPNQTGENAGILYDSIYAKIAPLGDQTLLYPAHGAGSACGDNISDRVGPCGQYHRCSALRRRVGAAGLLPRNRAAALGQGNYDARAIAGFQPVHPANF